MLTVKSKSARPFAFMPSGVDWGDTLIQQLRQRTTELTTPQFSTAMGPLFQAHSINSMLFLEIQIIDFKNLD